MVKTHEDVNARRLVPERAARDAGRDIGAEGPLLRIGAHVSSSGGHYRVFARAREIGAEAVQLFLSAPQQWKPPAVTEADADVFRRCGLASGIPAFVHGVYLMNFGSGDPAILERSAEALRAYRHHAGLMGVVGTIIHVGSHLGAGFDDSMAGRIGETLAAIIDEEPGNPSMLILENNAGQGNCIGGRFAELGRVIRAAGNHLALGVCLDTCHAFAMGYDLASPAGCRDAMAEFDGEIGFGRLVAVHANDSKQPLGTFRDRHENIGEGYIGLDGFRTLMAAPAFADVPFLLEVPGFKGAGPDARNVRRLKAIRAGLGLPAPKLPPISRLAKVAVG